MSAQSPFEAFAEGSKFALGQQHLELKLAHHKLSIPAALPARARYLYADVAPQKIDVETTFAVPDAGQQLRISQPQFLFSFFLSFLKDYPMAHELLILPAYVDLSCYKDLGR